MRIDLCDGPLQTSGASTCLQRDYLNDAGRVFAVFDERTQDSGNISYGVDVGGQRFFVKTAGLAARQ